MFWNKSTSADTAQDIELKTSEEWLAAIPKEYGFVLMDPDGWDRRADHFDFSFREELITKELFIMRLQYSTSICKQQVVGSPWAKK